MHAKQQDDKTDAESRKILNSKAIDGSTTHCSDKALKKEDVDDAAQAAEHCVPQWVSSFTSDRQGATVHTSFSSALVKPSRDFKSSAF